MQLLILHSSTLVGPNIKQSITNAQQYTNTVLQIDCHCIAQNVPTIQQLLCYDVVLFESVSVSINSKQVATLLHDFIVHHGRGVVVCMFSNASSSSQGIDEELFKSLHPMQYGTGGFPSMGNMGTRHLPTHCLLHRVNTLIVENASHIVAPIAKDAVLVASWKEDNAPMVCYKQHAKQGMVVCLNMMASFASKDAHSM